MWPVNIVVSDAVTNVVLHADRDGELGRVRVKASVAVDLLTPVVADDGVGMSPNPDRRGLGVGLALIGRREDSEVFSGGAPDRL
jgi:two-component sensor histidine kinase